MVTNAARHELHAALERQLGEGPAQTMMALLSPVGDGDVARRSDVERLRIDVEKHVTDLRGDVRMLEARLVELRGESKADIARLRTELKDDIAGLRTEVKYDIAGLRAHIPKMYAANLATGVAIAGMVLAAARLT